MKTLAKLALLALVLPIPPSQADADTDYAAFAHDWSEVRDSAMRALGMIAYARDESSHAEGIRYLEEAAMRGSYVAAHQLAFGYLVGAHGLPVDLDRSQRYFELSVRQESPDALLDYGLLLLYGHRFEADSERGRKLIRRAADLGHPSARVFLIEDLEAVGDDLSLAMADAWRWRMGMRLGRHDLFVEDREQRSASLALGYAMLADYFADNVRVPADQDRARSYASMVPEAVRGMVANHLAAWRYASNFDLRADHRRAKTLFEDALDTLNSEGINNFAWLLATSPDAEVRNGEIAVELMEDLFTTEAREPAWVDTLAAAYAETGDFARAIELQNEALTGFERGTETYEEAVDRRDNYAEGRAWRE
ncbi:MAG: hypothetical protein AAGE85_16590 [Pseudomonadota bacterium]